MKTFITALIFSTLLGTATAPAIAGPGEGHSHHHITKAKVAYKAKTHLIKLAKKNKVDKTWAGKISTSVEKKTYDGKEEWLVTFNNPDLADKSKQTLYMFFSLDGHYLATNYTGK